LGLYLIDSSIFYWSSFAGAPIVPAKLLRFRDNPVALWFFLRKTVAQTPKLGYGWRVD
jgi:hypothetical protein